MSTSEQNKQNQNQNPNLKQTGKQGSKYPNPQHLGKKFRNIRQRIRKAVSEETAGGVVFRRGDEGIELLMIQDPKGRWSVPKGKVEEGESLKEAAKREVTEETGLQHIKVMDYLGKVDFRFRSKDMLVSKTLHLFLTHAHQDSDNYHAEDHEGIKGIAWFSVNDALDAIEYDDIGKLFLLALKKIRNGKY